MANTFYNLAVDKAKKQPFLVNTITENSPVLATAIMQPTTNGLQHNYKKATLVDGPGLVDIDGVLPTMTFDGRLETVNLSVFGGEIEKGIDEVKMAGGKSEAFSQALEIASQSYFQQLEKSVLYNELRAYAIANGNYIKAGGSSTVNSSILCVSWTAGEIAGLYDPTFFGAGNMLEVMDMTPTQAVKNSSGVYVHRYVAKGNFGVLKANENKVGAIVNIDLTNAASSFTSALIDRLLVNARAYGNPNAVLTMPYQIMAYLGQFKDNKLITTFDSEINTIVSRWNGVRIIPTYNMLNATETTVS